MIKLFLTAIGLAFAAATSFAQSAAAVSPPPAQAASAPQKHKLLQKLKNHKPGQPASNPEATPFKSGGG